MACSPWLIPPPAGVAGLRLFCFPSAGGGGSVYVPWGRELAPVAEVWAVQLPGRESRLRERPYTDVARLLDATYDALRPYLDAPFALFGHSMGALLAFEFARRLRREGEPAPVRLLVSGHRAPELPRSHPPIAHLPDAQFITAVRQRYDGIPTEILAHAELMELLLPSLRADMALIEGYRCADDAPLELPISAYGGRDDAEAGDAELAAWRAHTSATFRMQRFPGAHFYVRTARRELLAAIGRDLLEAADSVLGARTWS